jgi:hypothetical protein
VGRFFASQSAVRSFIVTVLAAIALCTSLPNLYLIVYPMYGTFGFVPDENNVVGFADPEAEKSGVRAGDRIDFGAMPLNDHYQERFPLIGRTVTFHIRRGSTEHAARLTASYDRKAWISALPSQVLKKTAAMILIIIGAALFLVRPVALSRAFFFYAIGSVHSTPYFFSFLPMAGYFAVVAASDVLMAAGSAAFLWIGLNFAGAPARRWRTVVPLVVFVAVLTSRVIPDMNLMLLGKPAGSLYYVSDKVQLFCYGAGVAALFFTAIIKRRFSGERLTAGFMALAGAAMVAYLLTVYVPVDWHSSTTVAMRVPIENLSEVTLIVSIAASLAAAYVVIRMRVVDTGLVASRALSYGALSLAIVAGLAVVNWAYGAQLAAYPLAIPLEVVGAVAAGFWFSGFRDVANALALATIDAEIAATQGRVRDEHDALTRALGLAERTRQRGLIAEIRARCAFSAWVCGDDDAFARHIEGLRSVLGGRAVRGLSAFLAAADGAEYVGRPPLLEWGVRAELLACGSTADGVRAQSHARTALVAAKQTELPWLILLSAVAVAETCPRERTQSLDEAQNVARSHGWLNVDKALGSLRLNEPHLGALEAFVLVRLRKTRPARAPLEIAFFTGTVCVYGERISVHEKELELLFTLASQRSGMRDDEVMDRLWPDADGDAARNSFKVCLHRLRKQIGDSRAVYRSGKLYAISQTASVDLWNLHEALRARRHDGDPVRLDELHVLYTSLCDGAQARAKLGTWFAPFELLLERAASEIQTLLVEADASVRA